jgi:hypothetical protein
LLFNVTLVTLTAIVTKRTTQPGETREWVLLIHQLPPRPTNLRVRIWRQLQKLGAVAIKNSVYILPAGDKTHEDFQWLKQEVESAGGEVAVFRAASVAGTTDQEIIATFRKARDAEFAEITAGLDGLAGAVREQTRGHHISAARLAAHETELNRLHAELERVIANDFFNAKGRLAALSAYERCQTAVRVSQTPSKKLSAEAAKSGTLEVADYQGRRWVTRRNMHIDRLASAWLIKHFIDKRPRFYFVAEGETVEGAIPFDMFGAEFSHHGEDCTFETMLKQFGLNDNQGLRAVGQIVHDIDLRDDKFQRLEANGLNAIINGLSETLRDDRKLLQQTSIILEGLLALLGKQNDSKQKKQAKRKKKSRDRAKSSRK